jgi:hypothetical protein
VLVLSTAGGKVTLVVTVTRTINGRRKAGDPIRPIAQLVGGNGGGRPDMAQAGGPDVGKASEALAALHERVGATLGTTDGAQRPRGVVWDLPHSRGLSPRHRDLALRGLALRAHRHGRSKEVRDAALASGSYEGMGETFGQLDEVLVTLGAEGAAP